MDIVGDYIGYNNKYISNTLAVAEIIENINDIDSFRDCYRKHKESLGPEDIALLKVGIQRNHRRIPEDKKFEDMYEVIYDSRNKAIYEVKMDLALQRNDTTFDKFEEILPYAQTLQEKITVNGFLLNKLLTDIVYNQDKINDVVAEIKRLQTELNESLT